MAAFRSSKALSDLDLPLALVWRRGFQHPALELMKAYLKRRKMITKQ
jgi:hypothetical protein